MDAYQAIAGQYMQELMHVMAVVGGVIEYDNHVGRGSSEIFKPVPAEQQARGVKLLMMKGARPPMPILNRDVMNKIQPTGYADAMTSMQPMIPAGSCPTERFARCKTTKRDVSWSGLHRLESGG